jgi:ATP-binding cassette subfamily B protein
MIPMSLGASRGAWAAYIRFDEERDRPRINRALLRRVITRAAPYRSRVLLLVGLITLASLLDLVPPLLYRELLDNALPDADFGRLNLLALGLIGIPVSLGIVNVAQTRLSANIGEGITYDLRCSLYQHLQLMGIRFFTHTQTGEMLSRLNNDVTGAQRAVTGTLINIAANLITVISTLIVMISLEWRLTLLGVIILPLFIPVARRIGRVLGDITRQQMKLKAEMTALAAETLNIGGALLIKLLGREAQELERFADRAGQVRDIGVRQALAGRWFSIGVSLVGALGTALAFWIGGHLVLRGAFTTGTIVAFAAYLRQLYGPLTALTNARIEFAISMVSFERVFEVLDLPVEINNRPDAIQLGTVQGHVRFDKVSFSYSANGQDGNAAPAVLQTVPRWGRYTVPLLLDSGISRQSDPVIPSVTSDDEKDVQPWALHDVSFEIHPGQLVALVGPSGAGKTTITYLLPRLYDPVEGRITLDGYDLRDIDRTSLAANIGVVTQDTFFFHDTIRANLLYVRPDATQDQLEAACRAANIHDFIAGLPEGYDTVVGEQGYRLSGGEKQRLSIARVILKDPRVIVLDEATSHLDSESERLIQQALENVMQGRTSLVIAHRLSTILSADLILVIDKGRLVEQGTHAELLARNGLYTRLYRTQFSENDKPDVARESQKKLLFLEG